MAQKGGEGAKGAAGLAGATAPEAKPLVVISTCTWVRTMIKMFAADFVPPFIQEMYVPSGMNTGHESNVVCLAPAFNQLQQINQELAIPVPMLTAETLNSIKKDREN